MDRGRFGREIVRRSPVRGGSQGRHHSVQGHEHHCAQEHSQNSHHRIQLQIDGKYYKVYYTKNHCQLKVCVVFRYFRSQDIGSTGTITVMSTIFNLQVPGGPGKLWSTQSRHLPNQRLVGEEGFGKRHQYHVRTWTNGELLRSLCRVFTIILGNLFL